MGGQGFDWGDSKVLHDYVELQKAQRNFRGAACNDEDAFFVFVEGFARGGNAFVGEGGPGGFRWGNASIDEGKEG